MPGDTIHSYPTTDIRAVWTFEKTNIHEERLTVQIIQTRSSPLESILGFHSRPELLHVEVTFSEGASTFMKMPTLDFELTTPSGEPGWIGAWYAYESDESMAALNTPYQTQLVDETRIFISTSVPKGIIRSSLSMASGSDNWTRQRRGGSFFNSGSQEEKSRIAVKAGLKHNILVEFCDDSNPDVRLGGAEVQDPDVKMAEVVKLASEADAVIAIVGLNSDWETSGYDRKMLALPGLQTLSTAASPLNSRLGKSSVKPSARRAVDVVRTHRHGLSYTTFALSDLELSPPVVVDGEFSLTATVKVTNTGSVAGSEVVQLYVSMPQTSEVTHPPRLLPAFGKVKDLAPRASERVVLALDKIAVSYWGDHIQH
ncbi:hypothetical protein OG21DRAFT_1521767 [Imleria badia]|nr:hypothetical protein OG21DRAFT_1521767 [Imleria badia]